MMPVVLDQKEGLLFYNGASLNSINGESAHERE